MADSIEDIDFSNINFERDFIANPYTVNAFARGALKTRPAQ
jgi:hypothetical protein